MQHRYGQTSGTALRLLVTTVTVTLLAACTTPEPSATLSPVADPNAPMRVSTARVTTTAPDPVGQLFNDGPRQITTYSVNTDPLAVLFRDPAFVVKLSSPTTVTHTTVDRSVATRAVPAETTARAPTPIQTPPPTPIAKTTPRPIARTVAAPELAQAPQATPSPAPIASSQPTPAATSARVVVAPTSTPDVIAPIADSSTDTTAPVVAAAATTTVAVATADNTTPSTEPIVLNGLKQKTAGWPIATKPANVFGAKGPEGTAWRGLVYKSPAQTPVKAIDPGKVVFAQPLRGYGNVVIVDHGKDYTSIYGYNDALTKKVGDTVRKGETVALVGDSGPLADEALYFEIRKGSIPIDPSIYLATNP